MVANCSNKTEISATYYQLIWKDIFHKMAQVSKQKITMNYRYESSLHPTNRQSRTEE